MRRDGARTTAVLHLAPVPAAARAARDFLRGTDLTVTVHLHLHLRPDLHRVRVTVADLDAQHPVRRGYDRTSVGGRGLALVDSLTDSWGVDHVPGGKQVWFTLGLGDPPGDPRC